MATWEDVRRICLALPDVEERKQTFRTNGRIFVNMSHEEGAISTRAPDDERDLLIRARPDVYFVTPRLKLVRARATSSTAGAWLREPGSRVCAGRPKLMNLVTNQTRFDRVQATSRASTRYECW